MNQLPTLHLGIGDIILSPHPSIISTVLGSCVSVCLYSPLQKVGGMNHYAHPDISLATKTVDYRYGRYSIESMIRDFQTLTGENPAQWTAKIVGGAHENAGFRESFDIGKANSEMAREILTLYNIPIIGHDLGGNVGRKVLFHSASNRLQVSALRGHREQFQNVNLPSAVPVGIAKKSKIRVLIVDDSKTVRDLLRQIIGNDPELEIVGFAENADQAEKLFNSKRPNLITLDVHMPGKSGVEWLEEFLPKNPIPVVMITSLQLKEGNEIFRALEIGAVDYLQKPSLHDLRLFSSVICERLRGAAQAKVQVASSVRRMPSRPFSPAKGIDLRKVLAIGASTGGTEALKTVLTMLPATIPPTIIVQHIPPIFSKAFADRLNELCPFEVKEAEDGDELRASRVLVAPGGMQMKIRQKANGLYVQITDDDPVNRHKPSVDYLFDSVAALCGRHAVGVILTGMGADGAKGFLTMREAGALTLAQNEETCVVFGMPKEAIRLNAAGTILPIGSIAQGILDLLTR